MSDGTVRHATVHPMRGQAYRNRAARTINEQISKMLP